MKSASRRKTHTPPRVTLEPASFGAKLRLERERRRISIATVAESTKILGALLEGLERDDLSRWPTGLYRRAFLRAYASAIGLDPEAVVREFVVRFPEPQETPAIPTSAAPAPVLRGGLTGLTRWLPTALLSRLRLTRQ